MTQQVFSLEEMPPGLVAIPAMDWIWTSSAESFFNLGGFVPPGSAMLFGRESSNAAANRNMLVDFFLKSRELEWILFVDSDMIVPADTAVRFLSHGLEFVGARCFSRQAPYKGCFWPLPGTTIRVHCTEPCEVSWLGMGCVLVRRRVLEAIPKPWFEHPIPGMGEDKLFCEKVRAIGVPIYMDCGLEIGHMSARPISSEEALRFQKSPAGQDLLRQLRGPDA